MEHSSELPSDAARREVLPAGTRKGTHQCGTQQCSRYHSCSAAYQHKCLAAHLTDSTHQSTRGNQRRRSSTSRGGRRAARRSCVIRSDAASHNDTTTADSDRAARQHLALRVPLGRGQVLRVRRDARAETNPDYLADDANRYREAGLTLEPGPSIRKAYGWLAAVWKSTSDLGLRLHTGSRRTTARPRASSRGSRLACEMACWLRQTATSCTCKRA